MNKHDQARVSVRIEAVRLHVEAVRRNLGFICEELAEIEKLVGRPAEAEPRTHEWVAERP